MNRKELISIDSFSNMCNVYSPTIAYGSYKALCEIKTPEYINTIIEQSIFEIDDIEQMKSVTNALTSENRIKPNLQDTINSINKLNRIRNEKK